MAVFEKRRLGRTAPAEIAARIDSLRKACETCGVPMTAAALKFPLAHPAVSAIIPGPRSVVELEQNLTHLRQPIPAALWSELRAGGLLHPAAPAPERPPSTA